MRLNADHLIAHFDRDRDLRLSRAEFPGAPKLRVFRAGTDSQGRDVFTRMFYGGRISITIGLMTTLVALFIGVIYGSIAGYYGGRVDNLMMRIVDVLYGLPYLVLVIVLIVMLGRSTINLFIALGCIGWLSLARVIRGQVISLKTREFVEAARAVGVKRLAIVFRHLIPNTIGPVIVYSTLLVPGFILQEAFLSFLGLGVQPPNPSWGNMITEGATKLEHQTWLIYWPGTALALTLFAMNFLGDGIRDALDPQMQKE
jgi:oligopeptide transport system permease protein